MGSRSSSRTSSTNTTENHTFNNVDNRVGDEGGLDGNQNFNLSNSSISGGIAIQKTDLGAINKAFEFADSTLDFAQNASAPSANTINTIGKNVALISLVIASAIVFKSRFK